MNAALEHRSEGEEQTRRFGRALAALLRPGDLIRLVGPLGSGKTRLVQGVAEGLGVDPGAVCSPTFALVHTYRGRVPVLHADLYRIAGEEELEATGLFDLLDEAVVLVEWAERAPGLAGRRTLTVELADAGASRRRLCLSTEDAGLWARLAALLQDEAAGSAYTRVDSSGG